MGGPTTPCSRVESGALASRYAPQSDRQQYADRVSSAGEGVMKDAQRPDRLGSRPRQAPGGAAPMRSQQTEEQRNAGQWNWLVAGACFVAIHNALGALLVRRWSLPKNGRRPRSAGGGSHQ